ncbi:MAG TPA: hypothetical protein VLA44_08670 [Clostridia bacterium]|nr:hypothetical protein [Clostridia bacterium]
MRRMLTLLVLSVFLSIAVTAIAFAVTRTDRFRSPVGTPEEGFE